MKKTPVNEPKTKLCQNLRTGSSHAAVLDKKNEYFIS